MKGHCYECCQKESGSSGINKRYPKAVLEVCTCKFGAYPQVNFFYFLYLKISFYKLTPLKDSSFHQIRATE